MKIGLAILTLWVASSGVRAEVTDARASLVLDGGSYCVDVIAADGGPLHLFIANPSRRKSAADTIWILDAKNEKIGVVTSDTVVGKKLHAELSAAIQRAGVPEEAKTIFRMLDRLLLDPQIPWRQVYFPERWEGEANKTTCVATGGGRFNNPNLTGFGLRQPA